LNDSTERGTPVIRPAREGARPPSPRARAALRLALHAGLLILLAAPPVAAEPRSVSCLGRIEPGDGVRRVASPSGGGVIGELRVAEGDRVEEGQILATLVTRPLHLAEVKRIQAELEEAQHEAARLSKLSRGKAASAAQSDSADIAVRVAAAALDAARAQLALAEIRAPITGQVIEVHARAGEQIGPEGVVELGETDRMFAVAEVYETDIGLVRVGQQAKIESPALGAPLAGRVERIGLKVGRMDVIGTDPIAKTDARVVEVRIALDESERAHALTHLQVEVEIGP